MQYPRTNASSLQARLFLLPCCVVALCCGSAVAQSHDEHHDDEHELKTTFSDKPAPMRIDDVPDRPSPLFELGDPFLGTGPISRGFTIPTGALWQPSFLVYGSYRSAFQTFNDGDETFTEWANRLDIFGNLQLSGTERVLIGFRPLDEAGDFTGYFYEPNNARQSGWADGFNGEITHLFFEGDLGEIFPGLDPSDSGQYDIGFAVGRQPLFYQEGLLINDRIDAVGITKNNISFDGLNHLQLTALYGWNEINRGNNIEDDDAHLFGFFAELDTDISTINFDAVYVYDDDRRDNTDALYFAGSAVQRIGQINTSFRALVSIPQCMAFAAIAGLEPASGIAAAIVMGVVGSALSRTPPLVLGPAVTTCTMIFGVLITVAPHDRESWPALAGLIAVLAGGITIVAAAFRFGNFVRFVSRSVLVGLTAGAATMIEIGRAHV